MTAKPSPGRPSAGNTSAPGFADKVAFLASPAAWPGQRGHVTVKETHMSCVFLAGDEVLKLKKPVRLSFLDFSTLAAREQNCRAEFSLNRRLAPDVYLGVVALTLESDGRLMLGGAGDVVDWLVHMRRLPEALMLDHVIERGALTPARIGAIGTRLTRFYTALAPADLSPRDFIATFARELHQTAAVLARPRLGLAPGETAALMAALTGFTRNRARLLASRVETGQVIEGHGDLRPEHVCLTSPPVIIDCLEFNRALRLVDPFDELTFLGLECDILGAPQVGPALIGQHGAQAPPPPAPLLAFYMGFRATLRARLCLLHLEDPHPRSPQKWLPLARRYLAYAQRIMGALSTDR